MTEILAGSASKCSLSIAFVYSDGVIITSAFLAAMVKSGFA